MMKLTEIRFDVALTLVGGFALWCIMTEDPMNIVTMVTNYPWTFKVAMAFIIVENVLAVWIIDLLLALCGDKDKN